jgi:hypothetical protein
MQLLEMQAIVNEHSSSEEHPTSIGAALTKKIENATLSFLPL